MSKIGLMTVGTVSLLQEGFFRAFCDLVQTRQRKAGVDNAFLRELKSFNMNATLQDLDFDLKGDISKASSIILAHINKMGFKLVPKD